MKVSIFTDASVSMEQCVGGYAFYIGCVHGKFQKAGILKMQGNDTVLAEMHCIANAIYSLRHFKYKNSKPITEVIVYSDQQQCVKVLNGDLRSFVKANKREIVEEITYLMMEFCISEKRSIRDVRKIFTFMHVPAHTERKDKFSVINDWCDKNAKQYMRKAIKLKNTNQ